MPLDAQIFGYVVAAIICAIMVYYLRQIENTWTLLGACITVLGVALLLAALMDRRDAARAAKLRFDRRDEP